MAVFKNCWCILRIKQVSTQVTIQNVNKTKQKVRHLPKEPSFENSQVSISYFEKIQTWADYLTFLGTDLGFKIFDHLILFLRLLENFLDD